MDSYIAVEVHSKLEGKQRQRPINHLQSTPFVISPSHLKDWNSYLQQTIQCWALLLWCHYPGTKGSSNVRDVNSNSESDRKVCQTNLSRKICHVSLKFKHLHKHAIKLFFDEAFSDFSIIFAQNWSLLTLFFCFHLQFLPNFMTYYSPTVFTVRCPFSFAPAALP